MTPGPQATQEAIQKPGLPASGPSRVWRSWQFALFALLSLLALAKLLAQAVPGHYRVFTGAGRALWQSLSPYGTDFGTGVGYYFYSPTAALTLFGPLSFLPEKLGLVAFMGASWAVFVLGVRRFYGAFCRHAGSPQGLRALAWYWIAVSPQLFGGVLASKLEILMTGMILLSLAWLMRDASASSAPNASSPTPRPKLGRRGIAACLMLAATLNWKFQPLPLAGLAGLSWILLRRDWKLPATIACALAALYLLPFAVFPKDFLLEAHATWSSTFSRFVAESYLNFENLFTFLHNAFGIPFSFELSQAISAAVGAASAAFLAAWILRAGRRGASALARLRGALLLSAAIGSAYMTSFSPLGQNNALILYAPLLLAGFVCRAEAELARARRWSLGLSATFAGMTLLYSDAVPLGLRNELRHLSLKPLFCVALGVAIAIEAWRMKGAFAETPRVS